MVNSSSPCNSHLIHSISPPRCLFSSLLFSSLHLLYLSLLSVPSFFFQVLFHPSVPSQSHHPLTIPLSVLLGLLLNNLNTAESADYCLDEANKPQDTSENGEFRRRVLS